MKKNLADNRQKTYKSLKSLAAMLVLLLALLLAFPLSAEAAGRLDKKKLTLAKGTSYTLKAKGIKGSIKWSSSNPKVAKVGRRGKVTAKKAGKATITAKAGTKSYRCRVTVNNAKLNRKSASILVGSSYTFKVAGTNKKASWSSSDPKVAAVQNGKVTGRKAGTVTITAKVGDSSLKAKLKVFKNNSGNDPYDDDDGGNGGSEGGSGNGGYTPSTPSDVPAAFTRTSSNFWTSVPFATLSVFPSLICGSCPSGQRFAYSFFQIPPHGGHPCCSAMCFVVAYAHSGLTPVGERPCWANKKGREPQLSSQCTDFKMAGL